MNDWFTIDKIDANTYVISEYHHLEETHCYLLNGNERSLLIDTGVGISNIYDEVINLTDKPVTAVATHIHWDHIGGHKYFSDFYVHSAEMDWLNCKFPLPLETVKEMVVDHCALPDDFDINNYELFQGVPTMVLTDKNIIDIGGRQIEVLHTPGHSPGHCCFYEQDRGWLYSGNLIYQGCLDAFYPSTDPLAFMRSLEKVKALAPRKIFPAHHQLDIPASLVEEVSDAFQSLYRQGKLKQGNGVFNFGEFQIHI